MTTSPARTAPTPEEIEAAARILMRAWAPSYLLPGDHPRTDAVDDEDYDDPDEFCGCAGTDEDGESLGCNCAGGCICDSCAYYAYARYKQCWALGCVKVPAFRVVRYSMVDQYVQEPTARGAICPHAEGEKHFCTPDTVYVAAGPRLQILSYSPACSIAHAVELRDERKHPDPRAQYYLEAWTYSPHDRELPGPLPQLREHTRSAHDSTSYTIEKYATGGSLMYWLSSVRRSVALAAWNARLDLERPDDGDDDWDDEVSGPVQEEPSEPDDPE